MDKVKVKTKEPCIASKVKKQPDREFQEAMQGMENGPEMIKKKSLFCTRIKPDAPA